MPTRRDLLKTSAAAAAAFAIPAFVPSSVLGDDKQASANERMTMGFIGTGYQCRGHVGWAANHREIEVLAVCDVDTTRRENAAASVEERAKKLNRDNPRKPDIYVDYMEIINRKDIDAVLIASPDHQHAAMIIAAAKAGKHIYCEKPLTLTIREAQLCIEAVRKYKVTFQTGSQQRNEFRGWFKKAAAYVRAGRIGKVEVVTVGVGGPSRMCDLGEEKMEPGLDWDRWLGPAPMRPYHSVLSPRGMHNHFPAWRNYREYSGGAMTDIGAHHFDIAQWGLGMDGSGPVEIHPPSDPKQGRGVRYVYASGTQMFHGGPSGITFVGTGGTIQVDRDFIRCTPDAIFTKPIGDNDAEEFKDRNHKQDWFDCIKSGKSPAADVHIGAGTVTVCHLGNLAYWHGRSLRWDPKNWQFIDGQGGLDKEANTWLDYERRKGYELPTV
ncbi:MAG: Gfo/Idh/MocA family oxidoreductase [Phycisphaeraceae bacterium]